MRLLILAFLIPAALCAQHVPVFPELSDDALLDAIRSEYRPTKTLGYTNARDTLFRNILAVNNELKCLYTDYAITLDPARDPSDDAFNKNINTEHIYPQSKGAEFEPMRSNMYNLYPVRENVNNDRSNDPYGEVNDNTTQWWYYLDIKQKNKPATNIDLYSEKGNGVFEPKENRKGDIARSVMYFYTIYNQEATNADPSYFQLMSDAVCMWHLLDPVDQDEWNRNILIASYQEGRANPFILDCTIPERTYCSGTGQKCSPVSAVREYPEYRSFSLYPNTGTDGTVIRAALRDEDRSMIILNARGIEVRAIETAVDPRFDLDGLPAGIYYLFTKNQYGYITGSSRYIKF